MAFVNYKDLLAATNNGLDIIVMYYPDAANALQRRDKKFKVREEKTASASIRLKGDSYCVTDFGGDQQERNAIGVCMLETGKEFPDAVAYLGAIFNVKGSDSSFVEVKPDWESRPLKEGESPKDWKLDYKDFTNEELAQLGPCVTATHCQEFLLHSIKSFTYIKENEASITSSNDTYPIFAFVHDKWAKLYQPLSYKKQYRFRFLGQKPERFIYGLNLLKKQYGRNEASIMEQELKDEKDIDKDARVDYVFIVSGGSDGLNLRSFGYFPVWFNSESETLNFDEYLLLKKYAKEIIYVPDLDSTGLKQSLVIALKYLDIKIMMLPHYLKLKKDKRGNACKDFKDFVTHYYNASESGAFNSRLRKLVDNALPAQFWNEVYTKNQKKFFFRYTQFFNFLKMNGFGRIKDEHTKDGYHFVHNNGNVVSKVIPEEISSFVHQFLKDRQLPIELRDLIYAKQLNHGQLNKLDTLDITFSSAESKAQYMFFENAVLKITADAIEMKKRGDVDRFIWEHKLLKHVVYVEDPFFTIKEDVHGNEDIIINKKDNMFFNYLINASRVHWRAELETSLANKSSEDRKKYQEENKFNIAGPNLTDEERLEQKLHLINKIYALGYMMHTYKSPQKPWAVYAMDNKLADISESHGGSGKSVFLKAIQHVLRENHYVNGRDSKKTQDDFIYHGITADTDFIMVDDCHYYMDYGFFFNAITGDLDVNNKNGLRFVIPFDQVPKIAFASNYPPNNPDPSLERRLLYTVFSDYYHFNKDEEYNENRAVSDDFGGRTLFKDFDEHEWNSFYNFCAQCVQYYLARDKKADPPMDNVTMKNLMAEMGVVFKDWAEVFFAQKENKGGSEQYRYLDCYVRKDYAFDNFKDVTGYSKMTTTRFKKSLKAFAKFNEWIFNPEGEGINYDSNGRIMMKVEAETVEHFYIKTTAPKKSESVKASSVDDLDVVSKDINDDLPF